MVSVNRFFASLAVNDLLSRLHPYREEPNAEVALIEVSLASLEFFPEPESDICKLLAGAVAQGDVRPLLGLPEFSGR